MFCDISVPNRAQAQEYVSNKGPGKADGKMSVNMGGLVLRVDEALDHSPIPTPSGRGPEQKTYKVELRGARRAV